MASIQKRPDGRCRARYRDDAGSEHARHFARRVDGQRWLDDAFMVACAESLRVMVWNRAEATSLGLCGFVRRARVAGL